MYSIIANIDSRFDSLEKALQLYNTNTEVIPKVPKSRGPYEDTGTPRICVASRLEQCLTGIGLLGRLRRCLSANEDAKSYATEGLEIYPVLVLTFDDTLDYYKPYLSQVPDCDITRETWLLNPAKPVKVEVRWLDMYSIKFQEATCIGKRTPVYECLSVRWVDEIKPEHNHPWLTGKGHFLESSAMENEP